MCDRATDQHWPYTGYKLTAYSDKEEAFNELLWYDTTHTHTTTHTNTHAHARARAHTHTHTPQSHHNTTGETACSCTWRTPSRMQEVR
jgi:hypothetical protein